jgi:hypothetical protein
MMVRTCTNWNLIMEPLGTRWPSGGSSGSVWRIVAAREAEKQEDVMSRNRRKRRNGDTPMCCSRGAALRREKCNGFD